jgi:hypothetical protein
VLVEQSSELECNEEVECVVAVARAGHEFRPLAELHERREGLHADGLLLTAVKYTNVILLT